MVRRVYGSTPTSPWAWTDVQFRPLFSWNLVSRRGLGMAQIGPFLPDLRGRPAAVLGQRSAY
jgi:hypothetical protein